DHLSHRYDDLREVGHIGEKDGHLDDAFQARATRLEHAGEVAERLVGLRVEVANADELTRLVDPGLARDEEKVADPESLRKAVGLVRVWVEPDLVDLHGGPPSEWGPKLYGSFEWRPPSLVLL